MAVPEILFSYSSHIGTEGLCESQHPPQGHVPLGVLAVGRLMPNFSASYLGLSPVFTKQCLLATWPLASQIPSFTKPFFPVFILG